MLSDVLCCLCTLWGFSLLRSRALSLCIRMSMHLYTYVYAHIVHMILFLSCLCTVLCVLGSCFAVFLAICVGDHPHQTRARTCSFLRVWGGIICTCVCVCLCLCTCVRVCSRVCVNDVMCVGVHIRMISHTHTHTHTQTHTHLPCMHIRCTAPALAFVCVWSQRERQRIRSGGSVEREAGGREA